MKTATALTLMAVGAILTFAVTAHPRYLNLQIAGVVIMAVGLAGLLIHRRGFEWRRRRIVFRRGARGPVVGSADETNYPSYVMIDPASLQSVQPAPTVDDMEPPTIQDAAAGDQQAERVNGYQRGPSGDAAVVEEYVEE